VLALIAVGALARIVLLAFSWNDRLDPDAGEYLILGRRYSFSHPWSASFREPLWRAIEKIVTGPFDYSPHAQRIFTVVVSIAALPVAWVLFRRLVRRRGLPDRVAIVALAVVALSAQTIREAPRGLREDACMLLFLVFAGLLLSRPSTLRTTALVATPIALLSVIRWELATFAAFITILFAIARRATWAVPALAIVGIVALSGPWLLANKHKHGSLTYNTKVHATYYWKQEQPKSVRAQYQSPPADDPPVHLTWTQYYFDYLGVGTTVKRVAKGYGKVTAKLLASQVVPRGAAVSTLGGNQHGRGWKAALIALALLLVVAAVFIVRQLRRARPVPTLLWETLAIVILAILPYAALADVGLEMRVLMFTVPLLGLAAGVVVDAMLRARDDRRGGAPAGPPIQSAGNRGA
jgi:hypothetical protein